VWAGWVKQSSAYAVAHRGTPRGRHSLGSRTSSCAQRTAPIVSGADQVLRHHRQAAGHADQFVLIGGTAATLAMEEAGLEFRATKDLDIVLHIEALTPSFGEVFWNFAEADRTIDPKSLGFNSSVAEMVQRIAQACRLDRRRAT